MTKEEIDAFISEPSNDPDLKHKLLGDVQPQGYTASHSKGD